MIHTLKTIIPLAFVFAFLVATNFLYAAWTAPSGTPSQENNAPAPINVGISTASTQVGFGMLGFDKFVAFDKVQSDEYCDEAGTDCTSYLALKSGGGGSSSFPGPSQKWYNMVGARSHSVAYQNNTSLPIMVNIMAGGANIPIQVSENGYAWINVGIAGNYYAGSTSIIVPVGHYYRVAGAPYAGIPYWSEFR